VRAHFEFQLGRAVDLGGFRRAEEGSVYRLLLTTASPVVEECLAGEAASCWAALGVGASVPSWRAWIRPEAYVPAVAKLRGDPRLRDPGPVERCLATGDVAVCEGVLVDAGEQWIRATTPPPLLNAELVMDLAVYAAERGGPGAFERLQPSMGGNLRTRIGQAARSDPDEVVLAWVGDALAQGIDRSEDSRRQRSAALLWYLLLAIPAARSSRWRLD